MRMYEMSDSQTSPTSTYNRIDIFFRKKFIRDSYKFKFALSNIKHVRAFFIILIHAIRHAIHIDQKQKSNNMCLCNVQHAVNMSQPLTYHHHRCYQQQNVDIHPVTVIFILVRRTLKNGLSEEEKKHLSAYIKSY